MKRFLTILATGSALAIVAVAAPNAADARYYGRAYAYGSGYGAGPYAYGGSSYYGGTYGGYGLTCADRRIHDPPLEGWC